MDRARFSAIKTVYAVQTEGAYSNIALAQILRQEKLSDLDRRFCTELVYGTIKAGASLDWKISKYINRPLEKIDEKILAVLRVAMYQIFFLDRVPNSAAVNEAVEIAKKFVNIGASKFVNGVLRSAVREPQKSDFPNDSSIESLALRSFHPAWLVKLFVEEFGLDAAKKICATNNIEPPLCLRVNFLKSNREEILAALKKFGAVSEISKLVPEGIICKSHGALDSFKPLKIGLCQVQDESSMLAARWLNPAENDFVIDCCAAPGGKATHIAELMKNHGRIIAADIFEMKLQHIKENAARLGIKIIEPVLLDAREIGKKFFNQADKVLIDAPCSGLGVIRRKADLRWKKSDEEIAELPKLQAEILASAANAVKCGGILIYSTCTIIRRENETIVENFLKNNKKFKIVETKKFLPHIDGTDGFFIAKMIRTK